MTASTLLPCPLCGAAVQFHSDPEHCDGCHHIECQGCKAMFDLGRTADPENDSYTLDVLRGRIATHWNRRTT